MRAFPRFNPSTDRSRGAIAVEFAVAALFLTFTFFGTLEMGVLLRTRTTITDASREGARVAAALPRTPNWQNNSLAAIDGVLSSVRGKPIDYVTMYRADPDTGLHYLGQPLESCSTGCWRYAYDGAGFVQQLGASWDWDEVNACGGENDTDWIAVYVRGHHDWVTGFLGDPRRYTDTTVMRFEPMDLGVQCRP